MEGAITNWHRYQRVRRAGLAGLAVGALLLTGCTDSTTPEDERENSTTPTSSPSTAETPPGDDVASDTHLTPPDLAVSEDGRYLVDRRTGEPFPWLGDTAWRIARELDREEVSRYLRDRHERGFTVIQIVAFDRMSGSWKNAYGEPPVSSDDPVTLNEAYLEHVDYILDEASSLGLVVAMSPDFARTSLADGFYNAEDARRMGRQLAERYADQEGLVWVLGGDTDPTDFPDVIDGWIDGFRADGDRHLKTYHATGSRGLASRYFADADWIDFYAIQSSHTEPCRATWEHVASDYSLSPAKPTIDIEPPYEDHPIGWNVADGRFVGAESRRSAYWQLLAGSAGHTYGHNNVWPFGDGSDDDGGHAASASWQASLDSPGVHAMTHVRALLETRPVIPSIPSQSIVTSEHGDGCSHVRASVSEDDAHAFIYTAAGDPVRVDLTALAGTEVRAWWYDPRNGKAVDAGRHATDGEGQFRPPNAEDPHEVVAYGGDVGQVEYGVDWLLVLDAGSDTRELPPPGAWTPPTT